MFYILNFYFQSFEYSFIMSRKKRASTTKWMKKGGRLDQMEDEGVQISSEIFMFHGSKAVLPKDELDIIEQSCETSVLPRVDVSQNSPLLNLPLEILVLILQIVTVSDIDNLTHTCRELERIIKSRYIVHVMVPYPPSVLEHKKPVLKLTSTYDLRNLKLSIPCSRISYFSALNLNNLKELKMSGPNFNGFKISPEYKEIVTYILSSLPSRVLQKLEILIDNTSFCDVVTERLTRFVNLNELILRGTSYYHRDQDNISKLDFLSSMVSSIRVKILHLLNFMTTEDFVFDISSNTIQELAFSVDKRCSNFKLYLPNLEKLFVEGIYGCDCLFHVQEGELVKSVYEGCKKIRFYNDLDLLNLPGSDKFSSWFEYVTRQNREFCQYSRTRIAEVSPEWALPLNMPPSEIVLM